MSRALTPAAKAALQAAVVRPAIFFEGDFPSGALRLWSGLTDITWAGFTWLGAGTLLNIGQIDETSGVVATGTSVSLSGVPADLIQRCIVEAQQGRAGRLWLGVLNDDGTVMADPALAYAGRLDLIQISDGTDSCEIGLTYESRLVDLQTAKEWRYTDQSQRTLYPRDAAFAFVVAIQSRKILWGT